MPLILNAGYLLEQHKYLGIKRRNEMTKAEFIVERTRIISEMLDNPDKFGIYPTTRCFNELDALFDRLAQFEDIEVGRLSPMH